MSLEFHYGYDLYWEAIYGWVLFMSKKDAFIDAVEALEREDYETAYKLFLPLAEQGDADAQFNLGLMYEEGLGVPQDYAEAVKWWRLSAEQDDAYAQFNLGVMYDEGDGVPQDYAEAIRLWKLAAEQGDEEAQYNLDNYA